MRKKIGISFESIYPFCLAIVISGLSHAFLDCASFGDSFDNILNGAIVFSSIIVGFLGTLLAILFSIKNTELVRYIFNHTKKRVFLKYFRNTILSGLAIVIISSLLFLGTSIPDINIKNLNISSFKYLFTIWIFLCMYFVLASYRIVNIIMLIIFKDEKASEKKPDGKQLSDDEAKQLKEKLSNNKSSL